MAASFDANSAKATVPSSSYYNSVNLAATPKPFTTSISLAAAPTPTPTPAPVAAAPLGACSTSSMSASDTKLFWDSTYGFVGNELNSLPNSALTTSNSSAFTQATQGGNVVVNNYITNGQDQYKRVPVADVARVLGRSTTDVANDFAVDPVNGTISMQMAQAEADKNTALASFMPQLSALFASSPLTNIDQSAYKNYKIKFPDGKTMSLSQVFQYQDLNVNNDSCMLDNSFIQGRVSYMAQMDKDMQLGFDRSSSTLKANQHLTSSYTTAALSLNNGNSVVVPLRYERYMGAIKRILVVDTFASLLETGFMLNAQVNAKDAIAEKDEILDNMATVGATSDPMARQSLFQRASGDASMTNMIEDLQSGQPVSWNRLSGAYNDLGTEIGQANAILAGGVRPGTAIPLSPDELSYYTNMVRTGTARQGAIGPLITGHGGTIAGGVAANPAGLVAGSAQDDVREILQSNQGSLTTAYGIQPNEATEIEIQRAKNDLRSNKDFTLTQTYKDQEKKLGRVVDYLEGKVINNFFLGFAWLGTGRLALSLAKGLVLTSNDARAADNYILMYVNTNSVMASFREATNWALGGYIFEVASDLMKSGIPHEAYGVGPMMIVNTPVDTSSTTATSAESPSSLTSVVYTQSGWQVSTDWKGSSDATFFEDIRDNPAYARMPLFISNMTLGVNLNKRDLGTTYFATLMVLAPILSWKITAAKSLDRAFVPISRLLITDVFISSFVDPLQYSDKEICKDEVVNKKVYAYAALTAAGHVVNVVNMMMPSGKFDDVIGGILTKIPKAGTGLAKTSKAIFTVASYLDPVELAKMYVANDGFSYVSTCKDTGYTVVGYQPLDTKAQNGIAQLASRLSPLQSSSIIGNLSFGSALTGVGTSLASDSMQEIINLRSTLNEQTGMVRPKELDYLHLDGANEVSWGIYNAINNGGCFRKCIDGDTSAICLTDTGAIKIDKKTGQITQLTDRDRSLMSTLMQDIAREIVPNTLISAPLTCGAGTTMMRIKADAHLVGTPGCATTDCLIGQLSNLAGKTITGGDISTVMGDVVAVKATNGIAFFENGKPIRFIYTAGTVTTTNSIQPLGDGFVTVNGIAVNKNDTAVSEQDISKGTFTTTTSKVGTEALSPSVETLAAIDNNSITGSVAFDSASLNIMGDGAVSLSGYTDGTNFGSQDVGSLESIVFTRGRIEYDSAQNRLVAALYVLGSGDFGKAISGVSVGAATNVDGNGTTYNAIKINNLTARPGMQDVANELNTALTQAQGNGGFQIFETADHVYYFTKDASGNDILKVCDKNKNTCTDYKVTGKVTSDGSTVTVPTDKGPFTFSITQDKSGYPTLNATGPDGFQEIAMLLAAKGQNGMFVFDPYTGLAKILNGQDIPLNRDFASQGLTFIGSQDGTKGTAGYNALTSLPYGALTGSNTGNNALLSLPSVPADDLPVFVLMIGCVLCAVLAIRFGPGLPKQPRRRN